jgi:hypothetical protein
LLGQQPGHLGVMVDHAVQLAMAGYGKFDAEPEPVQRRVPGTQEPHRRRRRTHAAHVVVVLPRLQGDVVTEPLRLLVRVGVTTDIDQQRRVIHRSP